MRLVAATRAPRRIGYTYERRYLTRVVARHWSPMSDQQRRSESWSAFRTAS